VLLAVLVGAFRLPKIEAAAYRPGVKVSDSIRKHPNLLLGALGIFAYLGGEVSIGSFLVNYFGLPNSRECPLRLPLGMFRSTGAAPWSGAFSGGPLLRRFKAGYVLA
jgi:FHS family L-fucose permease-like MFS transporter